MFKSSLPKQKQKLGFYPLYLFHNAFASHTTKDKNNHYCEAEFGRLKVNFAIQKLAFARSHNSHHLHRGSKKLAALWQKHPLGTSEGVCIRRTPTDGQTLEVTVRVVRDAVWNVRSRRQGNVMKLSLTEFAVKAAL